jgi:hypothetical protein
VQTRSDTLLRVSIVETVLVFVGIPVLVYGLLALLVVVPGRRHRPRYRPGETWDYEPVWYVPQARPGAAATGSGHAAATGSGHAVVGAERAAALAAGGAAREALPAGGSGPRSSVTPAGALAAEPAGGSVQVTTEVAEDPAGEHAVPVRTAKGGVHDSW